MLEKVIVGYFYITLKIKMIKRFRIRIYPNKVQNEILNNHADAYRFLYNLCIEYKSHLYKYHKIRISGYDMQNELFSLIKEIDWMKGLKVECLRQAALDAESSFIRFYKGDGYPKFKSKIENYGFSAHQSIHIKNNKLSFFKQKIKIRTSKKYKKILSANSIRECSFKRDKLGNWFASFVIDDKSNKELPKAESKIGIDLGLNSFLTDSNGNKVENPKFLEKSEERYKKLQRKYSKSKKNGKNREKLRIRIAKIHNRVTNQKDHFCHQISNKLIFENQGINIENLKVSNMIRNGKRSKSISEVSWSKFINILGYKCNWYGRKLTKVDTFYPSSKLCSKCGNKKEKLELSERIYKCENCGLEIDRDLNAAINLANYSPTVKNTGSNASGDSYKTLEIKQEFKKEEFEK